VFKPLVPVTAVCMILQTLTPPSGAEEILVPGDLALDAALTDVTAGGTITLSADVTMGNLGALAGKGITLRSGDSTQKIITAAAGNKHLTLTAANNVERTWTFDYITFSGGDVSSSGGAIAISGGNASSTTRFDGASLAFVNNAGSSGGAVYATQGSIIFGADVLFDQNYASAHGAALAVVTGTILKFESDAVFTSNTSNAAYGGAIRNVVGDTVFQGLARFEWNAAKGSGGSGAGIYSGGTGKTVSFEGGVLLNDNRSSFSNSNGGAIYSVGSIKILGSGTITNNKTRVHGGAFYFTANTTSPYELILSATSGDIVFQGNLEGYDFSADSGGAANAVYYNAVNGVGVNFDFHADAGHSINFFDPISGANGTLAADTVIMKKTGGGTLLFDTHHTNIIATTTVAAGVFALTNGALYGGSDAGGSFTVGGDGTLAVGSGTVRAGSILFEDGAGLRVLDGGSPAFESQAAVVYGENLRLSGNGTIETGGARTAASIVAGEDGVASPSLVLKDAVTLANGGTFGGRGVLDAGTAGLALGSAAGDGVTGNVGSGETLAVSGTLSGGSLVKAGSGTLALSGANTYTGETVITAGVLDLATDDAASGIAASAGVRFGDDGAATLLADGRNVTLKALSGGAGGGAITLGSGTLTLDTAASTSATYAGKISAGALVKAGAGAVTLSGTAPLGESFAGDVTLAGGALNITGGTLSTTGAFALTAGATLGVTAGLGKIEAGAFTYANGSVINITGYSGGLGAVAIVQSSSSIAGALGDITLKFDGNAVTSSIDQYLVLQLQLDATAKLLQLDSGLAWDAATGAHGVFNITGGGAFATPKALADRTGAYSALDDWDGKSLVKTGGGVLTLAHQNTYTGTTLVRSGTLAFGIADAVAGSTAVVIESGAALDLAGQNQTLNELSSEAGGGILLGAAVLTATNAAAQTIAGGIADGGAGGAFIKQGAGDLTLSGSNSFSGGLVVGAGKLIATRAEAVGAGAIANQAALEFALAADAELATTNTLSGAGDVLKSGAGKLTYTAATLDAGAITVGAGALSIGSDAHAVAAGAASASVASGAALVIDQSSSLSLGGALALADNSTLNVMLGAASGTAIRAASGTIGAAATLNITGVSGDNLPFTLIDTTGGIAGDFAAINIGGAGGGEADYLTLSARKDAGDLRYVVSSILTWNADGAGTGAHGAFAIADSFNVATALADQPANPATNWDGKTLAKEGPGVLILSASNTYTGATLVNGGSLRFGAANAIAQSSAVTLAAGTVLDLAGHDQVLNELSGAGDIRLGPAVLTVSNTGARTLSGTITDGDEGTAGQAVRRGAGTLALTGAGTGGRVVKRGGGTLTLTGSNSHTGGVTIEEGLLVVRRAAALGAGDVVNHAALEFDIDVYGDGEFAGAITGADGSVTKSGAGGLILTGPAPVTAGVFNLDAGRLVARGIQTLNTRTFVNRSAIMIGRAGGAEDYGRLTINGDYAGAGGEVWLAVGAESGAGRSDQLVFAGGNVSGTTVIRMAPVTPITVGQLSETTPVVLAPSARLAAGAVLDYDAGDMITPSDSAMDWVWDPTGLSWRASRLSAAVPPAAAVPAVAQLMARAGMESYHERMGDLRDDPSRNVSVWARGLYREDRVNGDIFDGVDVATMGAQAGIAFTSRDVLGAGGRLDTGFLLTMVEAGARYKDVADYDGKGRGVGVFATWRQGNWFADLAANASRTDFTMDLRDGSGSLKFRSKWSPSAAFETGYAVMTWFGVFEPQFRVIYQDIQLGHGNDRFKRDYSFGGADSLNARVALRWHALCDAGPWGAFIPSLRAGIGREFRADQHIRVVDTTLGNDMGGSEVAVDGGFTWWLDRGRALYLNGAWVSGSVVDSLNITAGVRFAW
jgi:autotransporter-associated beta strand protein